MRVMATAMRMGGNKEGDGGMGIATVTRLEGERR
jgi:hypothetical protein